MEENNMQNPIYQKDQFQTIDPSQENGERGRWHWDRGDSWQTFGNRISFLYRCGYGCGCGSMLTCVLSYSSLELIDTFIHFFYVQNITKHTHLLTCTCKQAKKRRRKESCFQERGSTEAEGRTWGLELCFSAVSTFSWYYAFINYNT